MDLVLFDVDGTLVDTRAIIVTAMEHAFAEAGLPAPPRPEILSVVGLSLPRAIEALTPDRPDAPIPTMVKSYQTRYRDERLAHPDHEPLFDGALETIRGLAARDDVVLGIATGKSRRGVTELLARYDLAAVFTTIQTADDAPSKPHPQMVFNALAETGAEAERAVLIGDSTYDMAMARAARIGAIGVEWGFHQRPALEANGAQIVVGTFAELRSTLADRFGWTADAAGMQAETAAAAALGTKALGTKTLETEA